MENDIPQPEPNGEPMMRYFAYTHLSVNLQLVSKIFYAAARATIDRLPPSAERTVALRKLLEAKDAAVRAAVFDVPDSGGG